MENLPFIPVALQPYMPLIVGAVTALVIFLVGWIAAGWVHGLVVRMLRRRSIDEAVVRFLASLAQWLVIAAAVIAALARVGLETTSLVALLGTAGLAIGLALQGNLAHFASGVMLLLFRPIAIGDVVEIGGKIGAVEEIGLFGTTLVNVDNHKIIIPNGAVTGGPLTNFTALGKPRATIKVTLPHGTDVAQVVGILESSAAAVPGVLADPAPLALFVEIDAAGMMFELKVCAKPADFAAMQAPVRSAVYEALAKAGISMPVPARVIHQANAAK